MGRLGRFFAMKTLSLSTLILTAALAATAFPAGAASPTLSAAKAPADGGDTIRVVRAAAAPKSADCDKATWPYIPAACLQRETAPQPSNISLNN
ncbi:hypothetical protein [Tianweitania sediminis]|jgi:hypothetical protein|uniref:Uncharacterized protein n=1 Tax=Tianweitania sediminis TaxID=1502156 RepID=A0A8J7RI33_9HYPH|nr:hypothetical protein [Tianweitania sediminis]MBP0437616.1 hypothetical protein [Tianweitania sediminis]HEV7415410.1 hypothetical protein [Tianweitania sediminis]